ncbi:MAG: hypothetical protein H6744_00885 [Deltaproteobacteria bacterium]|nr:hypothetical protein [Deltaproteobacteria bacterium]MCB9785221.1 hypothetical protein [Deltaproteobacteria bacterium]
MRRTFILASGLALLLLACDSDGSGGAKITPVDATGGDATLGDASADGVLDATTDGVLDATADGATDATPDGSSTPLRVDPACIDGQFAEALPDPGADLSAVIAAYSQAQPTDFILAALDLRYPTGASIVRKGLAAEGKIGLGNCVDTFLQPSASAAKVLSQLSTIVHECGHFADLAASSGATFIFNATTTSSCQGGGSQGGPPATFARSLLNGDPYSPLRPPCPDSGFGDNCDSYANVYLDGDPTNGTFEGGDQGFDSVIEETTQYVGSLATGYAFEDQYTFSTSERDGILTFLWYVERYLRLARLEHPAVHAALLADGCWRRAILTVWGRAHLYLAATEGRAKLGLADDAIDALVDDPELLGEIQRVRAAEGCAAP